MSVFQLVSQWGATVSENDEFDSSHLHLANIDNSNPPVQKLIIGSLNGYLRIYKLVFRKFSIDDLIMEKNLQNSILQVTSGYVESTSELSLIVLQTRKVKVYEVVKDTSGFNLKSLYENSLNRNAYSCCLGKFGGVNKDQICVLSVDGIIQCFDYKSELCEIQLSDNLLPGPMCYRASSDMLIFANSAMEIEAYRLKSILAAGTNPEKKLIAEWNLIVGEDVLELISRENSITQREETIAITHQSLFVLDENGKLIFQKRFGSSLSCIFIYNNPDSPENVDNDQGPYFSYIIGTISKNLLIYRGRNLVWAATWDYIPIQIRLVQIDKIKGAILTFSDEGKLQISNLGTQPSVHALNFPAKKPIDYTKAFNELNAFKAKLKGLENIHIPTSEENSQQMFASLKLGHVQLSKEYSEIPNLAKLKGGIIECIANLSLGANGDFKVTRISISINYPLGIICEPSNIYLEEVGHGTPQNMKISIKAYNNCYPISKNITLSVIYQGKKNEHKSFSQLAQIPLLMFITPVDIENTKEEEFKITLNINEKAPKFNEIFKEIISMNQTYSSVLSGPKCLFLCSNGNKVGILLNKKEDKYRIQSSKAESASFLLCEFIKKVDELTNVKENSISKLSFSDNLLLQEIFDLIEKRFNFKKEKEIKEKELESETSLFRNIEKKLIQRFKDNNNNLPISNLEELLNSTYNKIMRLADLINNLENKIKLIEETLTHITIITQELIRLRFGLTLNELNIIKKYFPSDVSSIKGTNWEEVTTIGLHVLLTSILVEKRSKSSDISAPAKIDPTNIPKQIALICDRLSKGIKPNPPENEEPQINN